MPSAIIEKDFSKMLRALGRANRTGKQAALKAEAACTQLNLHGKIQLPRTYHGETRMNCEKYDLGDGYRLITQLAGAGPDQKVVMMFVGSHDDADAWLKRHKNYTWVMQNSDGKVEFIQVTVPEGERPHAQVEVSIDTPEHVLDESLLSLASDQDLAQGHFSEPATVILKGITKGDWGERSDNLIDAIESSDGSWYVTPKDAQGGGAGFNDELCEPGNGVHVARLTVRGMDASVMFEGLFQGKTAEGMTWQGVASIEISNDDCMTPCDGDIDGSGIVDVTDLLSVISAWGPCEECDADVDASGAVDVTDLLTIISAWGPCS